eukprot:GHVU01183252.1.p1 GENE.GHVU01183252.1~~GHVU01183252.1.p1  ORF type:complete len:111 (+),score=6.89 GHVU01183252.1:118-450(+)
MQKPSSMEKVNEILAVARPAERRAVSMANEMALKCQKCTRACIERVQKRELMEAAAVSETQGVKSAAAWPTEVSRVPGRSSDPECQILKCQRACLLQYLSSLDKKSNFRT